MCRHMAGHDDEEGKLTPMCVCCDFDNDVNVRRREKFYMDSASVTVVVVE
jgi:hypothetical protein